MSKSAIIFGNSPFIEQVDVKALSHHHTIGLNTFGREYKVDTAFFYDHYFEGIQSDTLIYKPAWMQGEGRSYCPKPADRPFTAHMYHDGNICLGFKYYSSSLALNWAILNSFKTIYLVGIDHIETDTQFKHWIGYGHQSQSQLSPSSHQRLKQFVYSCKPYASIYQTNPAVTDQWDLPYQDIEELYAPA